MKLVLISLSNITQKHVEESPPNRQEFVGGGGGGGAFP